MIGRGENGRRAAKVLLQLNDRRVRPIALEGQNIADIGAAPTVDRLVRIAGRTDVVVLRNETRGDLILGVVRILVFVDEQELETIAKLGADVGTIPE